MIWKLALNGLQRNRRDYLILFTGMIISVAVFYMFLAMALNKEFITQNTVINHIQLVFVVGAALLSVITFFYLFYTNSFLLSLRKKEFGLYELIGAKKHQLKRVFLIETLSITAFALAVGLLLGFAFSGMVSALLMNQLNVEFTEFKVVYLPAVFWTSAYFLLAALITSSINSSKLAKASIIGLLQAAVQNDFIPEKPKKAAWPLIVLGFAFLSIGYAALFFMEILRFVGLFTAPVMTTLGTYLLFSSLLPVIIRKWKSRTRTNLKGINAFTLSQLSFRLNDLKWVLATIAMLIALSAGAIAGGFAFKNNAVTSIDQERLYDATLYNPSTAEEEILKSLSLTEQLSYRFKMDDQFIYYAEEELVENPPLIVDWIDYKQKRPGPLPEKMETDETGYPILPDDWMTALETINPAFATTRLARMVPLESFEKTGGEEIAIVLARTDKFQNYIPEWQALDRLQLSAFAQLQAGFDPVVDGLPGKYAQFERQYAFASGTFFMGFFLGLAFLTMLASILMFKILSGAGSDIRRYDSLRKLGVRKQLLSASLSKEILIVFLFPAVLGLLHVLIGMRIFTFVIGDPYYRLWVSLLIFLVIYGGYYFFTVHLYRKLVLPKA